jgi:hypothetical protein
VIDDEYRSNSTEVKELGGGDIHEREIYTRKTYSLPARVSGEFG